MNNPVGRNQPNNVSDYIYDSILLESERINVEIDLQKVVSDLEIYESLDRPYLTGKIVLADNNNLIEQADILGGEKISLSLKSTIPNAPLIKKRFYIDEIMFSRKSGDHTEVAGFHLIEDICFISNLFNLNRYYNDNSKKIIEDIGKEFLDKEIACPNVTNESSTVIVPNMEPLEAMKWISASMSSADGYPYYLFSTFAGSKLALYDLGTMISSESINDDFPFRNYQTAAQSDNPKIGSRVIKDYRFEKSENLYKLIDRGYVGAEYEFIDTLTNKKNNFQYDVVEEFVKPLVDILPARQKNPTITPAYKHNEKSLNEFKSVKNTFIGGSNAFRTSTEFLTSYSENKTTSGYKDGIISLSAHNILQKCPLTFVVNGLEFIATKGHNTIGNNVSVEFLKSETNSASSSRFLDMKKSGQYLIYATKHMFKKEKYEIQLTGVKLANMDIPT